MRYVITAILAASLAAAAGCSPEYVTYKDGVAWRRGRGLIQLWRPDSPHRFSSVNAKASAMRDIRIVLPDDSVRALPEITKPMLQALNNGERRGDLMFAYHEDGPDGENLWRVTWPQHYHLFHPLRILLNRQDVQRSYLLLFRDEQVVWVGAHTDYAKPPDRSTWVPTFVHAPTGRSYRMPLNQLELTELFGPIDPDR